MNLGRRMWLEWMYFTFNILSSLISIGYFYEPKDTFIHTTVLTNKRKKLAPTFSPEAFGPKLFSNGQVGKAYL